MRIKNSNTMYLFSILLALAASDLAWPFSVCMDKPMLAVTNVTMASVPVRNINNTVKFMGSALKALSMRNVDLEVKLNGLHLDNINSSYLVDYD
jgi:hypothetical protein